MIKVEKFWPFESRTRRSFWPIVWRQICRHSCIWIRVVVDSLVAFLATIISHFMYMFTAIFKRLFYVFCALAIRWVVEVVVEKQTKKLRWYRNNREYNKNIQTTTIYLFVLLLFKCSFVKCNNMTTDWLKRNPYCLLLIDDKFSSLLFYSLANICFVLTGFIILLFYYIIFYYHRTISVSLRFDLISILCLFNHFIMFRYVVFIYIYIYGKKQ